MPDWPSHRSPGARRCRRAPDDRDWTVEATIGWPEKLFVRINGILPWLVDRSLARQLPIIQERFARPHAAQLSIQPVSREAS